MTRRGRVILTAVATASLVILALPTIADHITEPARPIEYGRDLQVFDYSGTAANFDVGSCWNFEELDLGGQPIDRVWVADLPAPPTVVPDIGALGQPVTRLRLHGFVGVGPWPDREAPSEHWSARLELRRYEGPLQPPGQPPFWRNVEWQEWFHSNKAPHPVGGTVSRAAMITDELGPGIYRWEHRLIGDESGVTLRQFCFFEV